MPLKRFGAVDLSRPDRWRWSAPSAASGAGARAVAELDARRLDGWYRLKVQAPPGGSLARVLVALEDGSGPPLATFDTVARSSRFAAFLWLRGASGTLRLECALASPERGELVASLRSIPAIERLWFLRRARSRAELRRGLRRALGPRERFLLDFRFLGGAGRAAGPDYRTWMRTRETASDAVVLKRLAGPGRPPAVDILMPVFDPEPAHLEAAILSVLAQTSPHWRLIIADDGSTRPAVRNLLRLAGSRDPRIRVLFRPERGGISAATNTAFAGGESPLVATLDHDDRLAPRAVEAVGRFFAKRPDAALLYSDEDKIDEAGSRFEPFFKPDWAPELLRSFNYVNHFTALPRDTVARLGGWRSRFDGAQDYDLVLRATEEAQPSQVGHLPMILYHWRAIPGSVALDLGFKPWATAAGRAALADHLRRTGTDADVEDGGPGRYRVRYGLGAEPPLVSVVVPTRDQPALLERCLSSLLAKTSYPRFEVLVVDNGSRDPAVAALLARIQGEDDRLRVRRDPRPFNFSAINNGAARDCRGDFLCFLNDDTEVIAPDWLSSMVGQALQPGIGCVGAKLLYGTGTIQHAGILLGVGGTGERPGVAGHPFLGEPGDADGPHGRIAVAGNWSAVTGACLVVRRRLFEEVGGFDAAELAVAFNDVDLCLKVRQLGRRNVYVPWAVLFHHESMSRGAENTPEKMARFEREADTMRRRYGALLTRDPFYSPHLTLDEIPFGLAATGEIGARLAW